MHSKTPAPNPRTEPNAECKYCLSNDALLTLARALRVAADNLDLVCHDRLAAIVHLERDVLDEESPHLVAETVGVQGALLAPQRRTCQSD